MRQIRPSAAAAAGMFVMLSLAACSEIEFLAPPPAGTVPRPLVLPPPAPAPPGPTESVAPPPPAEARAEIATWFAAAGYKDFQVAALLDHARTESGFRPCVRGAGDLSYTFQWSGTRLRRLHEFAHTEGCPQLRVQLAFADQELRHEPRFSCFWAATTERAAYTALRRGFGNGSC
jgi:hypothetical protein